MRGGERLAADRDRGREDLLGVVLDVPRRRIVLGDLAVGGSAQAPLVIEDERRRAGGALVQREDDTHVVEKRRIGAISPR